MPPVRPAIERFEEKYTPEPNSGCWLWTGSLNPGGYAQMSINGRPRHVHRFSYEHFVGPIPAGLQIDHLCRNRSCVNPDHLEPVTQRENIMRGIAISAQNARKTHCKNGHEFTQDNTRTNKRGYRWCKKCAKQYVIRRRREIMLEFKTGQLVTVINPSGEPSAIRSITAKTERKITLSSGLEFTTYGKQWGFSNSYGGKHIRLTKDGDRETIIRSNLVHRLDNMDWNDFSNEQLAKVCEIVKPND